MKKLLAVIIIVMIMISVFYIYASNNIKYSPVLRKSDIPGFYLIITRKYDKIDEFHEFIEHWESATPEEVERINKKFIVKGKASLIERDQAYFVRISRVFLNSRDEAKKNMFEYYIPSRSWDKTFKGVLWDWKENSPSGKRYGDVSMYLYRKNSPEFYDLFFVKGSTFACIKAGGKVKGNVLGWDFAERIAKIVEARL